MTVQGSSPRAAGELTMPFILHDALTEDRRWRGSMINCLGGRWRQCCELRNGWSARAPGCPLVTVGYPG
jgi:hypothetical protein